MPRREMKQPQWDVALEGDEIVIELVVPGSKFGAVDVRLERPEAIALGNALLAKAPTEQDRLVAVLADKEMNE